MEELFEIKSRFGEFPNYRITKSGKIFSLTSQSNRYGNIVYRKIPKERKLYYNTNGYSMIHLIDSFGKRHCLKIHTLVADTFIPNPNNYTEINHIDEDKTNNNVINLEWCSRSYNNTYNNKAVKIGIKLRYNNPRIKSVDKIDEAGNIVATYKSVREAARSTGNARNDSNLHKAIKKNYKCYGFYWKFSDNSINRDNQQPS